MGTGHTVLSQPEAEARARLIANPRYWPTVTLPKNSETSFRSQVRVTFDCLKPGSDSFIDIEAEQLLGATLNGVALDVATAADGRLPLPNLQAGNVLEISSVHSLSNGGQALTRVLDSEDDDSPYFHTQFEDYHAHKVFACFDQPDIKGRFTWTVGTPNQEWNVFANTEVASTAVAKTPGGGAFHTYETTEVLPTYLAAFVAGPFEVWEDSYTSVDGRQVPLRLMCRRSQSKYVGADKDVWFSEIKRTLRWLEDFNGFAYPFSKYDQVLVPGFKAGAMENPGLVTFYEDVIFRGTVSQAMQDFRKAVIRHEAAHVAGFGDVRTMKWWDDLWLNETFATTMEVLMSRDFDGIKGASVSGVLDSLAAITLDQMATNHAVATKVLTTENTHDEFDTITYEKGCAAMLQLIEYIGYDHFRAGVRRYFQSKWDNATRLQFIDALQAEAPAGIDLHAWAKQWVESKGASVLTPKISVNRTGNIESVAVEQTLAGNADPALRTHVLDIGLYDLHGIPGTNLRRLKLRSRVHTTVAGSLTEVSQLRGAKQPALLLVNDTNATYAKTQLDDASLRVAERYVGTIADAGVRAKLWTTMWNMTRDAQFAPSRFVEMTLAQAAAERDPVLLQSILGFTESALGVAYSTSGIGVCVDRRTRNNYIGRLCTLAFEQLDSATTPAALRLEWFDAYCRTLQGQYGYQMYLKRVLKGEAQMRGLDVATQPDLRWKAVIALARAGALTDADIRHEGARDRSIQGRSSYLLALAAQPTLDAKKWAYEELVNNTHLTPQEMRGLLAGYASGSDSLREPLASRFESDLEKICATKTTEEVGELLGDRGRPSIIPPAHQALPLAAKAMDNSKVTASAKRKLVEATDRMSRAQAALQLDAQRRGPEREVA